ncbi:MAG: hypothetical protein K2F62_05110, partial [Muribaculaceae bacterium]|nr:hypothetical protein [Muribaculaceae bacterium]
DRARPHSVHTITSITAPVAVICCRSDTPEQLRARTPPETAASVNILPDTRSGYSLAALGQAAVP